MTRIETDSIGTRELPEQTLYGVNTLRATENFDISPLKIGNEPAFIRALAAIKKAAAKANGEIGIISPMHRDAIVSACEEILSGAHHDQFVVDLLEGSGGTSINMNANEVIANRALQVLGHRVGQYEQLNPNDHVNTGQSTNDVVPSAVKLAVLEKAPALIEALDHLAESLQGKSIEFANVLKIGRTCMQAAQPMTLGQEFGGYAAALFRARDKIREVVKDLEVLPLGGTAIGTGLGAQPGYIEAVYRHLSNDTGRPLRPADNL
ncbi:MAG: aspartate ammonia-lyase, partial [Roseibium sp.]|uniref:lyase family protein n=1 Tax=Roseibium sp. TaxID=1936156 RepID=UPI002628A863